MDQNVKSSSMDAAVAPGSGVDLRLEEREVETLHVALAAGIAQGFEIAPVGPVVLVRQLLGEVLPAASAASGRQCHFQTNALPRERTAKSFSPLSPRCPLNKSRDACTELFSRRYNSHVQHQFLHGFLASLSSELASSHTSAHPSVSLTFSFHGNSRPLVWGESVWIFRVLKTIFSTVRCEIYTGPTRFTREMLMTEILDKLNFSLPLRNI